MGQNEGSRDCGGVLEIAGKLIRSDRRLAEFDITYHL